MKRIIVLILIMCALTPLFSNEDEAVYNPEEESSLGNRPVLVFGTIFVIVTGFLILRMATEKMKTKK